MTPEERAKSVADFLDNDIKTSHHAMRHLVISNAIEAAVMEEREACAALCQKEHDDLAVTDGLESHAPYALICAALIRARSSQPPKSQASAGTKAG